MTAVTTPRARRFLRLATIPAAAMAGFLAFASAAPAQTTNRVAAVVNGDVVTLNEVQSRRRLLALSAGITTGDQDFRSQGKTGLSNGSAGTRGIACRPHNCRWHRQCR